jgi:hypothetical protein
MMWWILLGAAIVLLAFHASSRNAVWGGATLGVAIGVIIALVRPEFDWWVVGKGLTIGTFVGAVSEWIPRMLAGTRRSKPLLEEHFQIPENATQE